MVKAGIIPFGISSFRHTFATFEVLPGTEGVYKAFKNLADGTTDKPFLLIYGGVGNGKTHLLEATAIRLGERGIGSRLWVVPDFLAYLKRLMRDSSSEDIDVVIERYQAGGALLLDDYGMEYGTLWEESVMERIIAGRYRSRAVTVITTNKDLDQVDNNGRRAIPERIVSRFFDPDMGVVVLNKAGDYRRRAKK